MSQAERLLYMIQSLEKGSGFTAFELIQKYEVCSRTVKRDISILKDRFDLPVIFQKENGNCYSLEKTDQKELKLRLEEEGFLLFSLIQSFCRNQSLFPIHLENIRRDLHLPLDDPNFDFTRHISYEMSEQKKIPYRLFHDLLVSIKNRRAFQIHYRDLNGKFGKRILEPHHLRNTDGQWYVLAWCRLRKQLRLFSIIRIENWKLLDLPFLHNLSDEEIHHFLNQGYGLMGGKGQIFQVKCKFTGQSAVLVRGKIWHRNQSVREEKDSLIISFPVESFEEILREVLFYHSEVEVLDPPEFRELWKEKILEMAQKVSTGTSYVTGVGV